MIGSGRRHVKFIFDLIIGDIEAVPIRNGKYSLRITRRIHPDLEFTAGDCFIFKSALGRDIVRSQRSVKRRQIIAGHLSVCVDIAWN